MGLYSKKSLDLLFEQINRDNPGLDVPFSRSSVVLLKGPLIDNLGSSGRNTRVVVNGIQGSGVNGKKEVFYDRLSLNKLYVPSVVKITAPSTAMTLQDLLPEINNVLGLSLETADAANPTAPLGAGVQQGTMTLTIASTSLGYTGSLQFSWTRAPAGIFPSSGPGTKVMLYGTLDAGWFGTVPESEMFNKLAFYNAVNEDNSPAVGTPVASTSIFYFKFAYKGRFIFVPSVALISNISWSDVYKMGAAYSPKDTNVLPPVAVSPVPQTRVIEVVDGAKTWQLSPRLPAASQLDPVDIVSAGAPNVGGEPWELYRHTTKKGAHQTGLWANIDDLGNAAALEHVIQTLISNNANAHAASANMVNVGAGDKTTYKTPTFRPVLELVNDLNLLRPAKFKGMELIDRLPSVVVNISAPSAAERLLTVKEVKGSLDVATSAPNIDFTMDVTRAVNPITWTTTELENNLSRVVASVEADSVKRCRNISWSGNDFPVPVVTIERT